MDIPCRSFRYFSISGPNWFVLLAKSFFHLDPFALLAQMAQFMIEY